MAELPELETIHSTDSESELTEISGTFSDSSEIPASESSASTEVKNFWVGFKDQAYLQDT